jgi:hypothetical protein
MPPCYCFVLAEPQRILIGQKLLGSVLLPFDEQLFTLASELCLVGQLVEIKESSIISQTAG